MTLALGLITPPYGLSLLLASTIGEIGIERILKTISLFVLVMIFIIIFVALFPDIVLFLPRMVVPNMV